MPLSMTATNRLRACTMAIAVITSSVSRNMPKMTVIRHGSGVNGLACLVCGAGE